MVLGYIPNLAVVAHQDSFVLLPKVSGIDEEKLNSMVTSFLFGFNLQDQMQNLISIIHSTNTC